MLKPTYIKLLTTYGVSQSITNDLWNEIETNYSKANRFYHNLEHLEDLLLQLENVKDSVKNWPLMLFSLYYHDIIYKSTKKNNEERSAELAMKRMAEIGFHKDDINICQQQILATKYHKEDQNSDTNLFIDADLSILGRKPSDYKKYCENIRKEYSIYPNFLYYRGRKKVINHFLSMKRLFKTEEFHNQYEVQAINNLRQELESLK